MNIPVSGFLTVWFGYNSAIYAIIGYSLNMPDTVCFSYLLALIGAVPAAFFIMWFCEQDWW